MANDDDPAAPTEVAVPADISAANFGSYTAENFRSAVEQDEIVLDAGPRAATTIQFEIQKALDFLQACETSHPRVTYGLGKKIKPGQVPGRDFTAVDCSGFVREAVRRATDLGNSFPDGSVVQHTWVENRHFGTDSVDGGKKLDGAVRIAFLPPSAVPSGIGHVVLIHNGKTLESHGGVGPDSRVWDGGSRQAKTAVFVLSLANE